MAVFNENLERISRSGEAVFAVDSADRIILWNKACERLLGRPARAVIGKHCYEVLGGRDANGNIYCHRNCAVAYQAREKRDDPVRRFELSVRTGDARSKKLSTSLFAVPSYHPALNTLVHVLRNGGDDSQPVENAAKAEAQAEPLTPVTLSAGDAVVLTTREKEILRCLAEGMSTGAIAKRFFISAVTVRNHVQSILHKLDVHTKLAAVVLAYRHGLV
jgi:DNA-binding CsgD family transcriptional regulator